ncbi:MAG: hypothetical protein LBT86_10180 [Deltaproteobacteria bacterium]|nr:hypothetical protein [Deltaproteobacteria bacterium]
MTILVDIAESINQTAGWRKTPEEKNGVINFELEDMNFSLWRLGDHLAAFRSRLGPKPSDEMDADVMARRLGSLSLVAIERPSVLSLNEDGFELHLLIDLNQSGSTEWPVLCEAFLNDLDWWRKNHRLVE